MRGYWKRWLEMAGCALCLGCASGAIRERPQGPHSRSLESLVTGVELARGGTDETLFGALRRYRPLYLRSHGAAPLVSIEGEPPLDLSVLNTLRSSEVLQVSVLRAPTLFDCCRDILLVLLLNRR